MDNCGVITALCSFVCVNQNTRPYQPAEWGDLAQKLRAMGLEPKDLYKFSDDDFKLKLGFAQSEIIRIKELFDRVAALTFELDRYENMGICVSTRAQNDYPKGIKKALGRLSPPLFYYAGNLQIADDVFIGFTGARNANENDLALTRTFAKNVVENGYSIVSGGARGVDSTAVAQALAIDGCAMEFIPDSLIKKIRDISVNKAIRDKKLVVLSAAVPNAGFDIGMALSRNRYIYASSLATLVVRSQFNKGGTWAGAIDNLKNNWSATFCIENPSYQGNTQLIQRGAIPVKDTAWNANNIQTIDKTQAIKFF